MWVRGVPSCHYLPAVLFWEEQPFPVMAARFLYPTLLAYPKLFGLYSLFCIVIQRYSFCYSLVLA